MVLLILIVLSVFGAISATDSQIDRQNDNYDSLNRYRQTESSSYGQSGGYYPRNTYDQLNTNRYNPELSGREFRPNNVFASMPSPYMSPLLAQPRQYQISIPGASGLMPYQVNGSPLLQSSGIGGSLDNQYSVYTYGGIPSRIGIGESLYGGQGYGYGNYLINPYYGIGGQGLAQSQSTHMNPYSIYGGQGLYSSPYSAQMPNLQAFSYANPTSGYLSRGYGPQMGSQFATNPYQSLGSNPSYNNGYNNYNNNNYSGVGSTSGVSSGQTGVSEGSGVREERTYASSASTKTETQTPNETPIFHSNRIIK